MPRARSKARRDLKHEHLAVFDCSFRPQNGTRSIHYMGHLKMMGAVQPFVSGAISKTINMPEECTVEDVMDAYIESWRLGLKAVAIYRDNSKKVQPMSSGAGKTAEKKTAAAAAAAKEVAAVTEKVVYRPVRRKLPDERQSITHKFSIGGHEGYITVGHVRGRDAGRNLRHDGEGRLDDFGADGQLRDVDQLLPAVWRAAEVPGGQVRARAVRAERLDGQSADPVCEVDSGLYFPVAGGEVPWGPSMPGATKPASRPRCGRRR